MEGGVFWTAPGPGQLELPAQQPATIPKQIRANFQSIAEPWRFGRRSEDCCRLLPRFHHSPVSTSRTRMLSVATRRSLFARNSRNQRDMRQQHRPPTTATSSSHQPDSRSRGNHCKNDGWISAIRFRGPPVRLARGAGRGVSSRLPPSPTINPGHLPARDPVLRRPMVA